MKAVLGTAGHIDHGKTALVRALTGVDTDRLPEEKRRGISIDLGFTRLTLGDAQIGIVDVPGHEDFIRNMLAGATGVDLLLLVVAADEGVMPQTREHVAIAELLGVRSAVVALTKADLAEPDWLDLVRIDLEEFLDGTAFAGAPVVVTAATTGQGMDELRDRIDDALGETRRRTDDLLRLPVDRAFTVRGTGTVITGTVWSGRLERDQRAVLLPGDVEARVRGLQVHGEDRDIVEAGERAAVALAGVDRDRVARGMTLVTDPAWQSTDRLTARLRVLPHGDWSLEPWQRVRVHLGTAEVLARTALLDDDEILPPGAEGWVQLRLETPLLARAGDRCVVRSYSPVTTIAGGTVVEPLAPKRSRIGDDASRFEAIAPGGTGAVRALLEGAGTTGVPLAALPILAGARPEEVAEVRRAAVEAGDRLFDPGALDTLRERLRDALDRHHAGRPLEPGMDPEELRRAGGADPGLTEHAIEELLHEGVAVAREGRIARADWSPVLTAAQETLKGRIATALADAGPAAPRIDELTAALDGAAEVPELLALLEDEGAVVRVEPDLYLDAAALQAVANAVRDRLRGREGLGPADFRDAIDVSRKHLMPLLGYLDREGVTVRDREGRSVPGP